MDRKQESILINALNSIWVEIQYAEQTVQMYWLYHHDNLVDMS